MDTSGVLAGINELNKSLKKFTASVNTMSTSMSEGMGKIEDAIRRPATASKKTAQALEQVSKAAKATSTSADSMGKSTDAAKKHMDNLRESSARTRYALYDVSATFTTLSGAFLGVSGGALKFAADYESAFTEVERTTMSNVQLLDTVEAQLLGLARDIPLAFQEITQIASLGAQLGVATGDLAGFSETVAQFSAVTNVSAESAAQSFGALGELLNVTADEYKNLGSSIAQVGVNSVATEAEILSNATAIAGVAASAGLSADYVVGLSGALASLRVPAEQSRGALTRVFQEVNRAAAAGGQDIQNFATILGTSTEEATRLAQSDMESFFTMFVNGLSSLDAGQLTTTLDALNLADIRVTNTLTRLSRNTDLFASTMTDANSGFEDGTFLAGAYALKVDDIASKFKILVNSLTEVGAKFGEALTPVVGPILDTLTSFFNTLADMLSTDAGKIFAGTAVSVGLLAGGLSSLVAVLALAKGSMSALRLVVIAMNWEGATKGFAALAASLTGVSTASGAAAVGLKRMKLALVTTGIGALVIALGGLAAAFAQMNESADVAFNNVIGDTAGLSAALAADTQAYSQAMIDGNTAAAESFVAISYAGTELGSKYSETTAKIGETAKILGEDIPQAFDYTSGAIEQNTRFLGDNTREWIRNKLMQSEAFQDIIGNSEFSKYWQGIGADFDTLINVVAQGGQEAGQAYLQGLNADAIAAGTISAFDTAGADMVLSVQTTAKTLAAQDPNGISTWVWNTINAAMPAIQAITDVVLGVVNAVTGLFGLEIPNPFASKTGEITKQLEGATNAMSFLEIGADDMASAVGGAGADLEGLGDSADGAAEKIRLLTDYSSDLSSIWNRAFDIRFSGQDTLDAISSSFNSIAKATADAAAEINSLNADIASLSSDRALQEYFLSVAEAYGDSTAADKARAEIAKIDADLAKKSGELQDAQDKVNKSMEGTGDVAISNRKDLRTLVSEYESHVEALAASGMSQADLAKETAKLKQQFIEQGRQLGYSEQDLQFYAAAFEDVARAIEYVPRDVTVDFNGDAALTAIQEFAAKAEQALSGAGGGISGGGVSGGGGGVTTPKKSVAPAAPEPIGPNWWDGMWAGWNGMWGDISTNWNSFWGDADANWTGMWGDFGAGWNGMWSDFGAGWTSMWDGFGQGIEDAFQVVWDVLTFPARLRDALVQDLGLADMWNDFVAGFNQAIVDITAGWNGMWVDFGNNVVQFGTDFITGWNATMEQMFPGWGAFWTAAGETISATWTNFTAWWNTAVGKVANGWNTFWGTAGLVIAARWNSMVSDFNTKIGEIARGWNGFWGAAGSAISNAWTTFTGGFSSAIGWIERTWNTLWGKLGSVISTSIDNAMRAFQRAMPATFNVLKPIINWAFGKNYADGGYVSGPGTSTSDSISANLSNGEYVINAAAVQQYGRGFFDNLNQMQTPRYFSGGPVGNTSNSGGIVSLSPEDRALLRNIGGSGDVVLYANNEAIARSANAGNRNIVASGGRP